MHPIPLSMQDVLRSCNVMSLATSYDDIPWAANAFFAFDEEEQRLIFLTSLDTRHGEMLAANHQVAGTISAQFDDIAQIHGLQFLGVARLLDSPALAAAARCLYDQRFPQAAGLSAPVWDIHLLRLKLTDSRQRFGSKTLWNRQAGEHTPGPRCAMPSMTTRSVQETSL